MLLQAVNTVCSALCGSPKRGLGSLGQDLDRVQRAVLVNHASARDYKTNALVPSIQILLEHCSANFLPKGGLPKQRSRGEGAMLARSLGQRAEQRNRELGVLPPSSPRPQGRRPRHEAPKTSWGARGAALPLSSRCATLQVHVLSGAKVSLQSLVMQNHFSWPDCKN